MKETQAKLDQEKQIELAKFGISNVKDLSRQKMEANRQHKQIYADGLKTSLQAKLEREKIEAQHQHEKGMNKGE
jgi:hypothetical protein